MASDDELVAWGQQLNEMPDCGEAEQAPAPGPRIRLRRREPLRAARPAGGITKARDQQAPPLTIDELFEDIAARAAAVHERARRRARARALVSARR